MTNTGNSVLHGDLGLYPGTSVTGFPPGIVDGTSNIGNTAAQQAQTDLTAAIADANSRVSNGECNGEMGGMTWTSGVYTATSSAGITGTMTLDCQFRSNCAFIFQIVSTLTVNVDAVVQIINQSTSQAGQIPV